MDRVRIYLKNPLFSAGAESMVPPKVFVIDATVADQRAGGMLVEVETWSDKDGDAIEGEPRKLFLPYAKIDHAVVLEDA